jgi:hypothetical protein
MEASKIDSEIIMNDMRIPYTRFSELACIYELYASGEQCVRTAQWFYRAKKI